MLSKLCTLLLSVAFCLWSISVADAVPFTQQIGDADNFGFAPGSPSGVWGDMRSPSEVTATNGAQHTDNDWQVEQRTFVFDLGVPILNVNQAELEANVYDLEDDDSMFGYPPDHVDIQIWIEGYELPEVFDNSCFRFISGVVTFDLTDFLSSSDLNDIFSDGIVTVNFLQAGTYIEHYAIDYVTLSGDVEPAPAPVPEPSTILLLGLGLVCIGLFGRKRFRK